MVLQEPAAAAAVEEPCAAVALGGPCASVALGAPCASGGGAGHHSGPGAAGLRSGLAGEQGERPCAVAPLGGAGRGAVRRSADGGGGALWCERANECPMTHR